MLLRFSVSNHRSIRKSQELSMVATSLKDSENGLLDVPGMAKTRAVPAAVVFGPNASGKSNLLLSLGFMREQILRSHRSGGPETPIDRHYFALSDYCKNEPTVVEADIIVDSIRYTYGFAATDSEFVREWLYSYPFGTQRRLFERTSANEVEFGPALKGRRQIMKELMRPNSLYLSVAVQNKHDEISKISELFSSMRFSQNISVSANEMNMANSDNDIDARAVKFIELCGTGIRGFRSVVEPLGESTKEFRKKFSDMIFESFPGPDDVDKEKVLSHMLEDRQAIEFSHPMDDGSEQFFVAERESAGTRRLLHLLRSCFRALDNGTLMVIDEIDASLHTQICEAIVYLFSDPRINTKGAQLIATTHDTNLLRSEFLRRDQIWLTEKDSTGATELFSLADIKTRASDNFELGYLQGRYGAVPFTGPVADLFAAH
jgi:AAA15 family ATPase/GTPase